MSLPKGKQPNSSNSNSSTSSAYCAPLPQQHRGPQPPHQINPRATQISVSTEEYIVSRTIYSHPQLALRPNIQTQTLQANSATHDMNKQQLSSQPGMPGTSVPPPQVPSMVYTQQHPNANPLNPQTYFPQRTHTRPISGMNQRLMMNPSGNPVPQQQYYSQLSPHNVHQISSMGNVPPMYSNTGAPVSASIYRQAFPQQSYTIPSQQVYLPSAGSYNYNHPGSSNLVYFTPPMRSIPQTMPTMAAQSAPPQRRERKLIRIQDPTTERDVTEELVGSNSSQSTQSMSGPASARETPPSTITPPPRNSEIASQFATQVAVVAAELPSKEQPQQQQPHSVNLSRTSANSDKPSDFREPKPIGLTKTDVPINISSSDVKIVAKSSESNVCPGLKIEPKSIMTPQRPPFQQLQQQQQPPPQQPQPPPPPTQQQQSMLPLQPQPQPAVLQTLVTDVAVEEKRVELAKPGVKIEFPESTKAPFPTLETAKPAEPAPQVLPVVTPVEEIVAKPLLVKDVELPAFTPAVLEPVMVAVEPEPVPPQIDEPEPVPVVAVVAPAAAPPAVLVEDKVEAHPQPQPQENGDVQPHELADATQEKWESESKDAKKQKGKKKQNSLNRKGDSKEGSEMDALVDKDEVVLPPPVPEPVHVHTNQESTLPVEDLISKEEQRKVAEKNEENNKVSREFERNEHSATPVIESAVIKSSILKYQYKEDQWSPLNPEGKRQYDRAFLLQMQTQPMSMKKPEGLPDLEIIKDSAGSVGNPFSSFSANNKKPMESRPQGISVMARSIPDFTPGYVKSTGRGPPVRSRSSQGKSEPKAKKMFNVTITQEVRLNKSENAWRPPHKVTVGLDPEIQKTEDLYRFVRGILNKLTPQKFNTLVQQVNGLTIDTEERLKGVIDLVFEKAIDEPNFSVAYANLCKCLALMKVPVSKKDNDYVNFRKLLLNRCQREFEKDMSDEVDRQQRFKEIETAEEDKKKEMMDDLADLDRRAKRRSLGNIRFIGELFKLGMLTAHIMHDCLKKLLSQEDEDSLECLCRLLTTIGKDLEADKNKPTKDASGKFTQDVRMPQYFKQMQEIVNKKQTSSRVRFMLQDVIDLRNCNWIPRRDENNPKTIDQIHQDAEREASEQQALLQQMPMRRHVDDRDKRKRAVLGSGEEGGWNTVSGRNSGRSIDPSKMKLTKTMDEDNIQLGPAGRTSSFWARGSSGGSRTNSQEPEIKSSSAANRFQALATDQSSHDSRRGVMRTPTPARDSSKGRGTQMPPSAQRSAKPAAQSQKEREREQAQSQKEREREQAIAAVKTIAGGDLARSTTEETREHSVQRDEGTKKPPAAVAVTETQFKGRPDINEDELDTKTKSIIDEYLHNNNLNDTAYYIRELCSHSTVPSFITFSLNCILERSSQARHQVGQLMNFLVKEEVISLDQYLEGLRGILGLCQEYAIDIPKLWEYLAELIVPVIQSGILSLVLLRESAQPCFEAGLAGELFAHVLHHQANSMGTQEVGDMWRASGLSWSNILQQSQDQAKFIRDNKLEFTIASREAVVPLPVEKIKTELQRLFKSKPTNEAVFDWIDTHVIAEQRCQSAFVRALMTAVIEGALSTTGSSISLGETELRQRCTILQKYLDHKEEFELQALFAIQALMHKLEHPKSVLCSIFHVIHDEDVISDDALYQWEVSEDPAEQEGKGVAVNSVRTFFTWLKEMENDSGDES